MKISDLLANKHSKGTNKYGYCTYCHQEVEWRLQRALNHITDRNAEKLKFHCSTEDQIIPLVNSNTMSLLI